MSRSYVVLLGTLVYAAPALAADPSSAPRVEAGLAVGVGATADRSARPYLGGGLGVHASDVLSFEVAGAATTSPDPFVAGEWRPTYLESHAAAGSVVAAHADVTARFAVVRGTFDRFEAASFQLYPMVGFGLAATRDDLEAVGCAGIDGTPCTRVAGQVHPTAVLGGGLRVSLGRAVAVRGEVRRTALVENLGGDDLRAGRLLGASLGVTWTPRVGER